MPVIRLQVLEGITNTPETVTNACLGLKNGQNHNWLLHLKTVIMCEASFATKTKTYADSINLK